MKIKIKREGKEIEIECKNPKGRDTKKGLKLLLASQKDGGNLSKIDEYMDFIDKITAEYTGMSEKELDDLDTDEKDKLTSVYTGKVRSKIDFLMSSLKSESSVQKAKQ